MKNPKAARNCNANDTTPIEMLAFQCRRRDTGSISAPPKKVSRIERTDSGQEGDEVRLGDVFLEAGDVAGQGTDDNLHQSHR